MIAQERVMEILKEAGVLLEGHFRLTSGRHSNRYLQCAKIFRNTKYSEELCAALAEQFEDQGWTLSSARPWALYRWHTRSAATSAVKTFC